MATVLIDGRPVVAKHVVCDPLPAPDRPAKTTSLQITLDPSSARHFESPVPVVFPVGKDLFRGEFQIVAHDDPPGSGTFTFITDGKIQKWL
jgi:hypothetical protein